MKTKRPLIWILVTATLGIAGCGPADDEEILAEGILKGKLRIVAPEEPRIEATAPITPINIGQATASGGNGAFTIANNDTNSMFPVGITPITWTVEDGAGTTAFIIQRITVIDTQAPTLSKTEDMQLTFNVGQTTATFITPEVSDIADPNPEIIHDDPNGPTLASGFPMGLTTVNWVATDASGNSATAIQRVVVVASTSGALAITQANVEVEATATVSQFQLTLPTTQGGQAPIYFSNDAPTNGFPLGNTTVTWTATDSAMTTTSATQLVTVVDTTPPELTIPNNVAANQGVLMGNTAVVLGTATATDLADAAPVVSNSASSTSFPVGETLVTWSAQDASGNIATATQTVTVNAYTTGESCSALEPDFRNIVFPIMNSSNPVRCAGCHTGGSPLTTPNGFAFPNNPPLITDYEVFRTVAGIDSNGVSIIAVKALGGAGHAGGNRFPEGAADPDYVALQNFSTRARSCMPDPTSAERFSLGSGYEQLHRIVSTLGSRPPTTNEINLVETASDQEGIETALDNLMDDVMDEPFFYERIKEMYNDLLLTNKSQSEGNSPNTNFDLDAFANRDYYEDNFSGNERNDLHRHANYGFARAPLELIVHVIETNRPFTEILTANYTMVNPYSAVIYGVNAGDSSFPFTSDGNINNHDRDDFRPVSNLQQTSGDMVPIAGIVSTHSFLARYPSTSTNVNRARARYVFDYFLGIDIEGLAPRDGLDLNNVIGSVPTFEDPQCTVCHEVMDPIAGLFTKRDNEGEYDDNNAYRHDSSTNGVPRMVPAGLSIDPVDALDNAYLNEPLVWLGQRLAEDDRFADRTVRIVLEGLTGITATSPATTSFINDTKNSFVAGGFNFKNLVKRVILSNFFRARNLTANEEPADFADIGAGRLSTPEELHRRITAVTGGSYEWRGPNSNQGLDGSHYLNYGGIDSNQTVVRTTEPTSLMNGIQGRIANQVACERVALDLYNSGTLFPNADENDTPDNASGETAIRQNLAFLHRRLLGQDLDISDVEINASYQLFLDARAIGDTVIPNECRGGGGSTDTNGTVLPWIAVTAYLLRDYHFLYQ